MADASYDVVIVGGGNKALIAAMYLTKYGGMKVGIFEDRHELGGGWAGEESTAPGFYTDHCSAMHSREYHKLTWEDFPEWAEYGAKPYDLPVAVASIFREDDTCCGVYNLHVDPSQEKTAEWFARFSERDAEKWLWFQDKMRKYINSAIEEWAWNPAKPFGEPDAMDKLLMNYKEVGINPAWTVMTYPAVLEELFESTEVRMLFARVFHGAGVPPDAYGGGFGILLLFYFTGCPIVYAGGVHSLAHASQRIIVENGGKIFVQHKVGKVIIENGKATGVRLVDGTEVAAKYAVLVDNNPWELCLNLVGEEHLSRDIIRKVKAIERDWGVASFYTFAFRERPRYKAESFIPNIHNSGLLCLGNKSLDSLIRECLKRRLGIMPGTDGDPLNLMVYGNSSVPEAHYAPPGRANVYVEQWLLPANMFTEQQWKEMEKPIAEGIIKTWEQYAPNVTWDNVIGYNPVTPFFTAKHALTFAPTGNNMVIDASPPQLGRWRPIPELARGKIPGIERLYACGAAWHPINGAMSWQGYNIYKVMAEDLNLRKPWEEKGRPY